MALILRRAALRGTREAVPTVLGLEVGIYMWALAASGWGGRSDYNNWKMAVNQFDIMFPGRLD